MGNNIDRKRFFQFIGASALATGLSNSCGLKKENHTDQSAKETKNDSEPTQDSTGSVIAISKADDPEKATIAAINALGGISRFVSKGDKVLIKPNIGWNRVPEQAANTNPLVVRAVTRMCVDAGAARVIIIDHTCDDAPRCYERSGIKLIAAELGVDMPYVEDNKFIEVDMGGSMLKKWPVYSLALEVDKIINVPVAKDSGLALLTIGMKNLFGLIGGARDKLHDNIHQAIAEVTAYFAPTLTVVDAIRILTANGPMGGSLDDVKKCDTVIASLDPVAADAKAAELFGIEPTDLPYLVIGQEMGLGTLDFESLKPIAVEA